MAEGGGKSLEQEPVKWGSLLQHSFSTLMDDSDSDTISEPHPKMASSALLDLKSPRISTVSHNNNSSNPSGLASPTNARPNSSSTLPNQNTSQSASSINYVIVRITVQDPLIDLNGVNYRCIRVSEHDRVKSVLALGLAKHNLIHELPSCWNLIQKLKNKGRVHHMLFVFSQYDSRAAPARQYKCLSRNGQVSPRRAAGVHSPTKNA